MASLVCFCNNSILHLDVAVVVILFLFLQLLVLICSFKNTQKYHYERGNQINANKQVMVGTEGVKEQRERDKQLGIFVIFVKQKQ